MARALGITGNSARLPRWLSDERGLHHGVDDAYAALANGGVLIKPNPVKAVLDRDGNLAWSPRRETRRAVRAETAYMATVMLEGPLIYGTAAGVRSEFGFAAPRRGRQERPTTRTTPGSSATHPISARGYGGMRQEPQAGALRGAGGGSHLARFMDAAHRGKLARDFQAPPGVVEVWIDADTGTAREPNART